ncbi:MAG: helix-turn-helix transcriptional regulator [Tatlockia sp.]|nr:helix-turn-helix transcriptional regulator [Tatlockia sp.]
MKITNKISRQASRLKKIRLYLGMTRKQFGEVIGISQYTIRSWENGEKNFTANGVERVILSLQQKLNFSCSFDWLMHGSSLSPLSLYEDSKVKEFNDIDFDPLQEKLLNEVVIFKRSNKSANVIVVCDNTFSPIAEIGDYIGLLPIEISDLDNFIGKIVFIALHNDNRNFGVLHKHLLGYHVSHLANDLDYIFSNEDIEKIHQFIWFRKTC